jgi:cell shape-determining protein MreD
MKSTRHIYIYKYAAYAVLLVLLYTLQTVPGLFALHGVKPIWVVPAAIAIAMMEDEFIGGIYGAAAGLLCDLGGFSLFGFKGFFVAIFCICTGLLVIYLMHCNLRGCLLFTFLTLLTIGSLEHFFTLGMHSFDDSWRIYTYSVLPTIGYSLLITPLMYYLIRAMHRWFQTALEK